jgi:hypothetical protein
MRSDPKRQEDVVNRLLDSTWLYWISFGLFACGWVAAVTAVFWPVAKPKRAPHK